MSSRQGKVGEDAAAAYLKRHGHQIIARNVRLARGEIDIIARSDELLLFVEVKAHKQRESGLLAVTEEKCARIYSAAEAWLGAHPDYAAMQCRFDLIIVTPRVALGGLLPPRIEHMRDIIH